MNEVPRGGKPHVFGLVCLALLGAGALVLGPALRGEFTNLSDRRDVLEDDRLAATARGDVGRAFELSDPRTPGGYRETPYAPLASLSSALDLALWEDDPVGHHATNLVLLLATAGLLAALVWRWTGSAIAACVALGLAVLHPLSSGTAAWISGRGAVLAALFLAGSLLLVRGRAFALRHVAPRPGAGRRRVLALGGAGALFACALLSDPRVAPLALLFPVVAVAFGNRKEGEGAAGMRISDCGLRIEESAIRNPQSAMERGGSYPPPDNGSGRPRGRELFQAAIFLLVALGAAALVFLAAPPSATLRFPDGVLRGLAADAAGAGWTVLSFLFPANLTVAPDLPTGAGVAPLLAAVVLLVLGAVVSLRALARG
ncbi:MAG: hypothetical protein HY720_24755, partial [Planctomycetes bacterium]|nr:hypothetical protein [Planctomycetota bacterium]